MRGQLCSFDFGIGEAAALGTLAAESGTAIGTGAGATLGGGAATLAEAAPAVWGAGAGATLGEAAPAAFGGLGGASTSLMGPGGLASIAPGSAGSAIYPGLTAADIQMAGSGAASPVTPTGAAQVVSAPPMPQQTPPVQPSPPTPPSAPTPKPGYMSNLMNQLSDPQNMMNSLQKMPGMLTQKVMGGGPKAPLQFAPPPPSTPMGQRMAAPQQLGGVVPVAPQGGGQGQLDLQQIMMLRRLGLM